MNKKVYILPKMQTVSIESETIMAAGSNTGDVNSDGTNITVPETGGGGNAGEAHSKQWDDIEETNEKEKPFNDFN